MRSLGRVTWGVTYPGALGNLTDSSAVTRRDSFGWRLVTVVFACYHVNTVYCLSMSLVFEVFKKSVWFCFYSDHFPNLDPNFICFSGRFFFKFF